MIRKYMLAMIQMDTQNDKGINLEQASAWIDEAALRGVKLVCFPEVMNLIGRNVGEGGGREQIPGIRQIFYAGKQGAWNLYPWREHYRGAARRKALGQYQRSDFTGRENTGVLQQTPYV